MFALSQNEFVIAQNCYGRFAIPKSFVHREVPQILLAGEVYEPQTLKLLCQLVAQGDVITGGAFIGDFFPALCAALPEDHRIWSFEPNPESYAAALDTMALNRIGAEQLTMGAFAVGAMRGQVMLQTHRFRNKTPLAAAARLVPRPIQVECGLSVEMTRLEDWVDPERRIAALHLDVEGAEIDALTGAAALIRKWSPVIILEARRPAHRQAQLSHLRQLAPEAGYRLAERLEGNAVYRSTADTA
ncbi:MAG: FkbM family methyltransferase [Mangrovicoccus sp.]